MGEEPDRHGERLTFLIHRALRPFGIGDLAPMVGVALVGVGFAEVGSHVSGGPGSAIAWTGYGVFALSLLVCFIIAFRRVV